LSYLATLAITNLRYLLVEVRIIQIDVMHNNKLISKKKLIIIIINGNDCVRNVELLRGSREIILLR